MGKPRSTGFNKVILLKVLYLPAIALFIAGKFILYNIRTVFSAIFLHQQPRLMISRLLVRRTMEERCWKKDDAILFLYCISCIKNIHIVAFDEPEILTKILIRPFTFCSFSKKTHHLRNRNIGL